MTTENQEKLGVIGKIRRWLYGSKHELIATNYQEKQKGAAKWIFWLLVAALVVSFYGAASVTFHWPPFKFLKETSNNIFALHEDVVDLEGAVDTATHNEDEAEKLSLIEKKNRERDREIAELATYQYLAWVFASLAGASIYLMGQVATYYPKIKKSEEKDDKADFKKYWPWYMSTFVKAPVMALVVMWFLVNLKVELGGDGSEALGISVNFSQFGPYVMIGAAFVLGFYGRVARKQLDIIAKYLFTRAWVLAEEGFELMDIPKTILLNDTHILKTKPAVEVTWASSQGEIDPKTGTYKAPNKVSADGDDVTIHASLRSEPSSNQFAKFKLKAIRVKEGYDVTVIEGETPTLTVETKLEEIDLSNATWKVTKKDAKDVLAEGKGSTYKFGKDKDDNGLSVGTYLVSVSAKHIEKPKETDAQGADEEQKPKETDVSDTVTVEVTAK